MNSTANAHFTIESWDEEPYSEGERRPKLTRASIVKTYAGDMEGDAHLEYLMVYRDDGSASFVGLEEFVGTLHGKSGSFVLQRTGTFEDGAASETYIVVAGSGAGDLTGLEGGGSSSVGHGMEHPFELEYQLG